MLHARYRKLGARIGLGVLLALWGGPAASAADAVPNSAIAAELKALASKAGLIFVGQIVSIEHRAGVVEITFQVEQPVSGAPGARYTMREWAGLWPPALTHQTRYSVGQRVLAFVHAPSAAGLSSPVHGAEGLVPVAVQGAQAPELLDIRRIAASVVRAPGVALPTEADGAVSLQDALATLQAQGAILPKLLRVPFPLRGRLPTAMQPRAGAGLSGTGLQGPLRADGTGVGTQGLGRHARR